MKGFTLSLGGSVESFEPTISPLCTPLPVINNRSHTGVLGVIMENVHGVCVALKV